MFIPKRNPEAAHTRRASWNRVFIFGIWTPESERSETKRITNENSRGEEWLRYFQNGTGKNSLMIMSLSRNCWQVDNTVTFIPFCRCLGICRWPLSRFLFFHGSLLFAANGRAIQGIVRVGWHGFKTMNNQQKIKLHEMASVYILKRYKILKNMFFFHQELY